MNTGISQTFSIVQQNRCLSSMGRNTEEAVPLQLTPSLEQYVCKRNARIYFVEELGVRFAETDP
jgi:hypothetical protein